MAANNFSRHRAGRSTASRRKIRRVRIPQTSLVEVTDALSTICATVDVAASALAKDENEQLGINAGQVLLEHVYEPLEKQRAIIEAHSKYRAREHSAQRQRKVTR